MTETGTETEGGGFALVFVLCKYAFRFNHRNMTWNFG